MPGEGSIAKPASTGSVTSPQVHFALRKGARRRLGLVEQISLDNRRRLVLVRKDDAEYLLLVGGGADLHIATMTAPEPFTLPEGPTP